MLKRVIEDDESYLRLTRHIGKIGYCLHKFYNNTFRKVEPIIAKFFLTALYKRDDINIQMNAAYNLPALASVFDYSIIDCTDIYL